jgi:ankyrin repeat protein
MTILLPPVGLPHSGVAGDLTVGRAVGVQGGARCPLIASLAGLQRVLREEPSLLQARDDQHGGTLLIHAAEEGQVEVVRWLVNSGAALNERTNYGYTALYLASWYGRTSVVRLLLQMGADPAIASFNCCTPLLRATARGHLETVR